MEIITPLDASQDDSKIRLYRRMLFCVEGNKSVGAQVAAINDKLYVGLGKFWRQDGWKANRWAPGKKGSHIFLTAEQYRALASAVPKISTAVQLVEDLIHISTNEFEDISVTSATVANAGSGTVVSGTKLASLSAESVPAAADTTTANDDDEPISADRGTDACDGELQELREPSASQDKDKKTQDVSSATTKRKRGRPSKVSGQEGVTPKASKSKTRKTDSVAADATAAPAGAAAAADATTAPADLVLSRGTSADVVLSRGTSADVVLETGASSV